MNVQELINKLKKYPPKLNVGVQFSYPMEEGQIKNTVMGAPVKKIEETRIPGLRYRKIISKPILLIQTDY